MAARTITKADSRIRMLKATADTQSSCQKQNLRTSTALASCGNFPLGWFTEKSPNKSQEYTVFPHFTQVLYDLRWPSSGCQPKWKINSIIEKPEAAIFSFHWYSEPGIAGLLLKNLFAWTTLTTWQVESCKDKVTQRHANNENVTYRASLT